VPASFYPPPDLKKRIEREARSRNERDDCSRWDSSTVVVDILLDHFAMEKSDERKGGSCVSNGRPHAD
jgi:hypothetical protein